MSDLIMSTSYKFSAYLIVSLLHNAVHNGAVKRCAGRPALVSCVGVATLRFNNAKQQIVNDCFLNFF